MARLCMGRSFRDRLRGRARFFGGRSGRGMGILVGRLRSCCCDDVDDDRPVGELHDMAPTGVGGGLTAFAGAGDVDRSGGRAVAAAVADEVRGPPELSQGVWRGCQNRASPPEGGTTYAWMRAARDASELVFQDLPDVFGDLCLTFDIGVDAVLLVEGVDAADAF